MKEVLRKHILIEKGSLLNEYDYLSKSDILVKQFHYILDTPDNSGNNRINKYNIANYYYYLACTFNEIAIKRKISRNQLWQLVKRNEFFKKIDKTSLRTYKYIFRGEVIPSPKFVKNSLLKYEELPTYIGIIYLDECIIPELKNAYNLLTQEA